MSTFQNLTLEKTVEHLRELKKRRIDIIAPVDRMFMHQDGAFSVEEYSAGLPMKTWNATPNNVAHEHIAAKFGIPRKYWRKCYEELPRLAAAQFNQWVTHEVSKGSARSMFFRAYKNEGSDRATMRALLSNSYLPYDNYSLLGVVMEAVKEYSRANDVHLKVSNCDISEKRLYIRFTCPSIEGDIKKQLGNYKDPHTIKLVNEGTGIVSGFTVMNSEVGFGRLTVAPLVVIKACNNGMIWYDQGYGRRHVGGKMDDGVYQEDTHQANFDLIGKQVRDNIASFLNPEFLNKSIEYITAASEVQMLNPYEQAQLFSKEMSLSDTENDEFFNCLLNQGQMGTGFDFIQALTSTAKKTGPDRKFELQCKSTDLLGTLKKVAKFSAS